MKKIVNKQTFANAYETYFKSFQSNFFLNLLILQKKIGFFSQPKKKEWFCLYPEKAKEWFDIDYSAIELNLSGLQNIGYIFYNKKTTKTGKPYFTVKINWDSVMDYVSNIINNFEKLSSEECS